MTYRHGARVMFVKCVSSLAIAEAMADQPARAITLMSAAQGMNASAISTDQQERLVAARKQPDPRELAEAMATGHAVSFYQTIQYALREDEIDEPPAV